MAAWLQVKKETETETARADRSSSSSSAAAAAGPSFFVLQLGDLLDGCAAATALGLEGTLERLLAELARLRCPVYHCLGGLCVER